MDLEKDESTQSFAASLHLSTQMSAKKRIMNPLSSHTSFTRSTTSYSEKPTYSKRRRKRKVSDTGLLGETYAEDQVPDIHYMYIPSWTLVAHHRFPTFFWECVNHYFDYQSWPEWDALPEKFVQTCERFQVSPSSVQHYPGWAPIWLYVLRKLDERWFKAVVENFFENHTLPTWDELPSSFVQKFDDLRIHEQQYFE